MNMPAGEFKAKCLKIMETVAKYGNQLVITKYGKPVAKLVPVPEDKNTEPYGYLQGTISIKGDITKPTGEKWDAEKE